MRSVRSIGVLSLGLLVIVAGHRAVVAETVLSNVAFQKPTSGTEYLSPVSGLYPTSWGVDGSREVFSHGTSDDDSVWRVDLGQAFDLATLKITCRRGLPERTNGATLRLYGEDGVTQIGFDQVLTGFVDDGTWNRQVFDNFGAPWTGARYVQIGGPGISVPYLHVAELEAMVAMPTYSGFISGVTVTASDQYDPTLHPSLIGPQYLTDGGVMSDQVGPLAGDPAADCKPVNAGYWQSSFDPVDPTLTFDLGGIHDVGSMLIWNCNIPVYQESRALKEVLIETSLDDVVYTPIADHNGADAGNATLGTAPLTGVVVEDPTIGTPYQANVSLAGIQASHVRITALSNYDGPYWSLSEVRFYEAGAATGIPGDANHDGVVDAIDASILGANWMRRGADWSRGDFNADAVVNDKDAAILAAHWSSGTTTATPEPGTWALLAGAALGIAAAVRRRFASGVLDGVPRS